MKTKHKMKTKKSENGKSGISNLIITREIGDKKDERKVKVCASRGDY